MASLFPSSSGPPSSSAPSSSKSTALVKAKQRKVLLMGKSGSGKSSMRSIIFSNYVAKDVRRLGATIDVEHSRVKFLGNLTLNLWDCGGQEAFTQNYLSSQKPFVFSNVGVLIYVFDIESPTFASDLITYSSIVGALQVHSSKAHIFALVHKMDLVQPQLREKVFMERRDAILENSSGADKGKDDVKKKVQVFATSIWDQSLYKAWGSIVHSLIPNLATIEAHLSDLGKLVDAEEVILFERATVLKVTHVTLPKGMQNPHEDRFERLSNIIKTWKQSVAIFSGNPTSNTSFKDFSLKTNRFNLLITQCTANTYVMICFPAGEVDHEIVKLNLQKLTEKFQHMGIGDTMNDEVLGVAGSASASGQVSAPSASGQTNLPGKDSAPGQASASGQATMPEKDSAPAQASAFDHASGEHSGQT